MNPLDNWFIGMGIDDVNQATSGWLIPEKVRTAVVNAVFKHEAGIGTGPTLREVINHYMNELAYAELRTLPDELLQHFLDKAMQYTDVGSHDSTTHFKLPSLRFHMDFYNIGQFEFMNSEYYHAKIKLLFPYIKEIS